MISKVQVEIYLSKSRFIRGLQCHKSLWLYKYKPELRTLPDESLLVIFNAGADVGLLGQNLFPGGVAIGFEDSSFQEKIEKTKALIERGVKTIYEATFQHDGVLVMVDILHKGHQGWDIYEVKSTTEVKDIHLPDLAIQYYVLQGSGLNVSKACLVHINNKYVRQGELDVRNLFTISRMTGDVKEYQNQLRKDLVAMKKMLRGKCPAIDIGPQCSDPYECDYMEHCWSHVPHPSVFDITRLKAERKFGLYYQGILKFKDIPDDYPLNSAQRMQVKAEITGKSFINKQQIEEFISSLYYPLYYLDFETFKNAIPPYEGLKPYENIPFLYSIHYQERESGKLAHIEFLAKEGTDPREVIAKHLTEEMPSKACVLTWNMSFEKNIISTLADRFPKYAKRLMSIHDSIIDLMVPFQKKYYYTKEMNGSYSIKAVLPALVPELSYDNFEISNGDMASNTYATLNLIQDKEQIKRIRKALLEYCKLDTLAMVKIVEKMRSLAGI
ncbi:MAG TPA: DUF2779 domain-containing protein [Syntrophales bacterium]|nr:DUF2779 domain-containing protein [Syntrophales bacterium]